MQVQVLSLAPYTISCDNNDILHYILWFYAEKYDTLKIAVPKLYPNRLFRVFARVICSCARICCLFIAHDAIVVSAASVVVRKLAIAPFDSVEFFLLFCELFVCRHIFTPFMKIYLYRTVLLGTSANWKAVKPVPKSRKHFGNHSGKCCIYAFFLRR